MKHIIKQTIFLLLAITLLGACAEDKVAEFRTVNKTLKINLNDYTGKLNTPLTVKVTNYTGVGGSVSSTYEISNLEDKIELTDIIPGQYTITVSGKLDPTEATEIFGVNSELMLQGTKVNVEVFEYTQDIPLVIDMEVSTTSALIFKEIYYAGTRYINKEGASATYFFEQFYEIYNNSDQVIYLDSLYISNIYPLSGSRPPEAFDPLWDDYLFGVSAWMIPGTGQDAPLAPGKSVVIALSGRNFKEEVSETLLDMSSADYEAYVEKLDGAEPLDYPVPNLTSAYWVQGATVKQWAIGITGPAVVIFKLDHPLDKTDTAKPLNSTSKTEYVKIPKSAVLDAVDCLPNMAAQGNRRFPASLDAGFTTVGATYNGKSVARKIVQRMPDGRIIFQDTNNSSEDFEVMDTPMIRRYLNN